jgi:transketolase
MAEKLYARDVYGQTLVELGTQDSQVVVMDADLSGSTRTKLFAAEFPKRFFNVGVAEQNMMAIAAGLASAGKTVFVSTFAMFATARALDQVRNLICYNNSNVKIVATHGGITVGEDGASHQAIEDISFFRSIPTMRIIVPSDGREAREAIIEAYKTPGPFFIRLGRSKVTTLEGRPPFALGKANLVREGGDVALISTGIMLEQTMAAADILAERGITAAVVNMPSIKPIDADIIVSLASRVKGFVTCEEHSIYGGLGSAVAEVLCESLPSRLRRIGIRNRFGQSGNPEELMKEYNLLAPDIVSAAESLVRDVCQA